jgi:hypothetical protein
MMPLDPTGDSDISGVLVPLGSDLPKLIWEIRSEKWIDCRMCHDDDGRDG